LGAISGVIHVLVIEAMVGDSFLLAMRGIIGPIEIKDEVLWDPVSLPLLQIEPNESSLPYPHRCCEHSITQASGSAAL
jgi:hypothetical protein